MIDRSAIAREAAAELRRFADKRQHNPVLIGFDGFVDSIIAVVDKRYDEERFDRVATIGQLSKKINAAAGESCNYELVVTREKLGGNGPIMANALALLGFPVTYIGCVGYPTIHPVFEELAGRARCIPIANPGLTDALEFDDGKLLFGKYRVLGEVSWQRICAVIGAEPFARMVAEAKLLGMVNWTMLPHMNTILQQLRDEILPAGARTGKARPFLFIDLADPQKRTSEALKQVLKLCADLQGYADVILGLNYKEAVQVGAALDLAALPSGGAGIEEMAGSIRERLNLATVVIHPRGAAAACAQERGAVHCARFAGPFTSRPRLSTGAGDVFNAGFCLGRLAGLPLEHCLAVGTASSGYYVRNAASASLEQLADFLDALPEPEPS